jgi:hypothetical protein
MFLVKLDCSEKVGVHPSGTFVRKTPSVFKIYLAFRNAVTLLVSYFLFRSSMTLFFRNLEGRLMLGLLVVWDLKTIDGQ